MKMGKSNTELLKVAEKYLGQGGSRFRKFCGLPANAAWCNAYVDYVAHEGGDASLYFAGKKYVYVPDSIKWCYKNLADIPIYLAMPMDIIFFDWNGNGTPDHIGFVRSRNTDQKVNTIEGNTSGGIVAKRTRPVKYVQAVFRPDFPGRYKIAPLEIDGQFGYNSIAMLQFVLGIEVDSILGLQTVKAIQKLVGVKQDGSWGKNTSMAVQKLIGAEVDGWFGEESVKALQRWINNMYKTNSQRLADKANDYAYSSNDGRATYPDGKPKTAYKNALNKAYPNRDSWNDASKAGASCDVFVGTCVINSGIDKSFPRKLEDQIRHLAESARFTRVNTPQDGDIIVYRKDDGKGHICIVGNGKIKEAAHNKFYPKTTSTLKARLSSKGKKWMRIYRAV